MEGTGDWRLLNSAYCLQNVTPGYELMGQLSRDGVNIIYNIYKKPFELKSKLLIKHQT